MTEGAMADAGEALVPGTRLDDLEIETVLGVGGFGVTYLARDMSLDARRAVKEYLPPEWGTRRGDGTVGPRTKLVEDDYNWGLQRFLDEARILARFDHRNLVRVLRVFEARGTAYMVMEHVDGWTLRAEARAGPLREARVREVLGALADGLMTVHEAGLLHRDIKPGNVMVRGDGTPVLIDFGSARQAMGQHSRSLTAVITPGYAPIEQYSAQGNQGPWTDIYALGALAYWALSGVEPPDATLRVRRDPLVPVAEAAKTPVSGRLAAAVDQALAVDEQDRPQSLDEWAAMLDGPPFEEIGGGQPQVPAPGAATAAGPPQTVPERRKKVLAAVAVGVLVAILALGLSVFWDGSESGDPAAVSVSPSSVLGGSAVLVVETTPSGAEVLVDGVLVGKTPLERSDIRAGMRVVTLQHPYFETASISDQSFEDRKVSRVERKLQRGVGSLTVLVTPRDAWVEVEGKRRAERTPVTLEDVPAGPAKVRLGAPGYRAVDEEVNIPTNGVETLELELEPMPDGTLTLELVPPGAEVTLPDLGQPYRRGMRLPGGRHRVVVSSAGYLEAERTVEVAGPTQERIALDRRRPGASAVFDAGGVEMEFRWIPAGMFRMGSTSSEADDDERPVRQVRISRGFWLGQHEVTQGEWEAVMGRNPSFFDRCGSDCPVEQVSWDDVQEYIGKLNAGRGGNPYRLPTEAEWEYAARAGTTGDTHSGDLVILGRHNAPVLDGIAWYGGNSGVGYEGGWDCSYWAEKQHGSSRCGPHPVGGTRPNAWGLHDMLGNMWEWVLDWYGEYPGGAATDPTGPTSGSHRVRRGGCWFSFARRCRSASRGWYDPGNRFFYLGFRLVRTE